MRQPVSHFFALSAALAALLCLSRTVVARPKSPADSDRLQRLTQDTVADDSWRMAGASDDLADGAGGLVMVRNAYGGYALVPAMPLWAPDAGDAADDALPTVRKQKRAMMRLGKRAMFRLG